VSPEKDVVEMILIVKIDEIINRLISKSSSDIRRNT
jgi:hypothetical protein